MENKKRDFKGKNNPNWKGGIRKRIGKNGKVYLAKHKPKHLNCDKKGYVMLHRLIMEKELNRFLEKIEVIHHIDGNSENNDISNLRLFKSNSEHIKFHNNIKRGLI